MQPFRQPPGPRTWSPLGNALDIQKDGMKFALDCWREYGDVVRFRFFLAQQAMMLYRPEHAAHVLQKNYINYDKRIFVIRSMQVLMGNGLFSNDDHTSWLKQRRLLQPLFHRKHLEYLDTLVTDVTQDLVRHWKAYAESGQAIDIEAEMKEFLLRVIGRTLFSLDLSPSEAQRIEHHTQEMVPLLSEYMNVPFPPLFVPTLRNRRLKRSVANLDAMIYSLIDRYQSTPPSTHDLLSLLLSVRDEEGKPMSDRQVRDEIMTFLLGGHETTAHALAWTWCVLSQHPEVEERFHTELAEVLRNRLPTLEDLPKLVYTRMIVDEVLRLYPSAFALVRHAAHADEIDGYAIPKDSLIVLVPYAIHRHPEFWEHPDEFDPERFAPEQVRKHPFAYIPFGGGPHLCIGNHFGMMLVQLILATLAQQYRLCLVPHHPVDLQFRISLRSRYGLLMTIHRR